ncbi:MAG: HNH endonuclease [Acidobacteria bacterium]|nr:HNH endonuclease [Acidobacteriota bacterium]
MPINAELREQVRARANFACEYCGVTETYAGGLLTIDHYQPQQKGGDDSLENLLYCCYRCNQYKLDYWPSTSDFPQLWHPQCEPFDRHFLLLADGVLHALTPAAAFTITRLRLNRAPLVAHRLHQLCEAEQQGLLKRYEELLGSLRSLAGQQAVLLTEQQKLLREQHSLLALLLRQREEG